MNSRAGETLTLDGDVAVKWLRLFERRLKVTALTITFYRVDDKKRQKGREGDYQINNQEQFKCIATALFCSWQFAWKRPDRGRGGMGGRASALVDSNSIQQVGDLSDEQGARR